MAKDQDQSISHASVEALISKCLEIISQLCTLSDRFENDVYPILAKLLESDESGNLLFEDGKHSHGPKHHSLLLSVLLCLKHSFESSCGRDLAGLIPSCGSMILPLLSDDHVGDSAVDTIKAMLKIELSGFPFPRNPLQTKPPCSSELGSPRCSKRGFDVGVCITTRHNAAKLLDFIEKLPEQQLF
jgi:hypothetical protein